MSNTNNTTRPSWQAGLAGGCGGCGAALLTHPIELLKVRFQLRGELQTTLSVGTTTTSSSVIKTVANIFRTEGFPGFYRGLSASLLRQALFTSSR